MPTVIDNLAQIRLLLDEPTPERPSDRLLFQLFSDAVVHHKTRLQNSNAQWDVNSFNVSAANGQEDYLITNSDFGKPFWVYAFDANDVYHERVEIPFCMIQNASQFYTGPWKTFQSSTNLPSAAVCSFYRKGGNFYFRLTPVPGGPCTYTIFYETLPVPPQSLQDDGVLGLSPFHHLVRAETAIAALPYCAWGHIKLEAEKDAVRQQWQNKYQVLSDSFENQRQRWDYQFSTYLAELMQAGIEPRQPWGYGYDYDDFFWGGTGSFGPNLQ